MEIKRVLRYPFFMPFHSLFLDQLILMCGMHFFEYPLKNMQEKQPNINNAN
jgi:hypothetical protein